MRAGDLTRRIAFHSPVAVADGYGGSEDGWQPEFTIWANVRYLRGSEPVLAARLAGRQPVILTVRKSSDSARIATDWKAVLDGVEFNIRESPKPSDDRLFFEMLAESGVAVGV